MALLYNLLLALGFIVVMPFYLARMIKRGNYREGFWQRFGFYPPAMRAKFQERRSIWFRAVSVGEVAEALVVIKELRTHLPETPIVLSVVTTTGYAVAKRRAPDGVTVTYYPMDFSGNVRRALNCFRPRLIVLVESDLWPNLVRMASKRKIPVAMINARISDKSFRGYQRMRFLFKPAFSRLALALAPETTVAARLAQLGPPQRIETVGSLKYEVAAFAARHGAAMDVGALLKAGGAVTDAPVLVAGSTHPGEEAIFFEMLPRLRKDFPNLFLVVAPRHAERANDVMQLAERMKVACVRRTTISKSAMLNFQVSASDCLLLDTTGELAAFYRAATVIFVGKSLTGRGGQNILEAAITGKPVVFGPHMENFRTIAREFVDAAAALEVADAAALEAAVRKLLASPSEREALGDRASGLFEKNLGTGKKTAELLLELVNKKT